jgi:hypothetical protein
MAAIRCFLAIFMLSLLAGGAARADNYGNVHMGVHIGSPETLQWDDVGVGWWRMWDTRDIWPFIETSKDHYEWAQMDRRVAWAQAHGLRIMYTLGMTPPWASTNPKQNPGLPGNATPPADVKVWGDFVEAVARRYKGRISYYEIWNETDHPGFWSGTSDQYVAVLKEAAQRLRAVDPSIKIVAPCFLGVRGTGFLHDVLAKAPESIDIISFHGYVQGSDHWYPPERGTRRLDLMRQTMRDLGVDRPLWDTEVGYPPDDMAYQATRGTPTGSPRERMAAYLVRTFVVNYSQGVDNVFWYNWQAPKMGDLRDDPVTNQPSAPRHAMKVLANLTNSCHWANRMPLSDDDAWVVPCQSREGTIYVMWTTSVRPVRVSLPGSWTLYDLDGKSTERQNGQVDLLGQPIYGKFLGTPQIQVISK